MEPMRWIARYEWRELTDMEKCACGTFWKSIGDAMGISYECLPSHAAGWRDGLAWLDEVDSWAENYEARVMVPDEMNHIVANETTDILLWDVPDSAKPAGRKVVSALMDARLRAAMIYEPAPGWLEAAIQGAFAVRKQLLRHAFLPRSSLFAYKLISEKPDANGRYFRLGYESEPWYVKPTFGTSWGLQGWLKWLGSKPVPGDESARYQPEGYVIRDVGPKNLVGKGHEQMKETYDKLMSEKRGGCPFGGASLVTKQ